VGGGGRTSTVVEAHVEEERPRDVNLDDGCTGGVYLDGRGSMTSRCTRRSS
jgi:hypothetical protein